MQQTYTSMPAAVMVFKKNSLATKQQKTYQPAACFGGKRLSPGAGLL